MLRRAWFFLIIFLVILVFAFFLVREKIAPNAPEGNLLPGNSPVSSDAVPSGTLSVSYTDNGFVPSTLTVQAGDSVTFVNDSSGSFWPASAIHPSHTAYPTTGGCIGSTFDACEALSPGSSWSFVFDIPGSWKYHNHLNAGHFGTIVVETQQP